MEIISAQLPEEISIARELFKEYEASINTNLCFQNFEKELAELPWEYCPPGGRLWLAREGVEFVGCIALHRINDETCEMKRLYVKPSRRGKGIGKKLAAELMKEAKNIGYKKMRLDTLPSMKEALAMYRTLGFYEIAPYRFNPVEGAIFMERVL